MKVPSWEGCREATGWVINFDIPYSIFEIQFRGKSNPNNEYRTRNVEY